LYFLVFDLFMFRIKPSSIFKRLRVSTDSVISRKIIPLPELGEEELGPIGTYFFSLFYFPLGSKINFGLQITKI